MKERTPSVEAAGVGRSILSAIQDRGYAKKESGKIDWRVAMAGFYAKFKVDLVRRSPGRTRPGTPRTAAAKWC